MRILILSDIHANLNALEAVLADVGEVEAAWCLGDLVGYGPDPNECIVRVRQLPQLTCVLGNHDAAALHSIDVDAFNPEARQAIQWTQRTLDEASLEFLKHLPELVVVSPTPDVAVTLAHGSPRHPVWEYLLDHRAATVNFQHFETPLCFVGHTHLPVLYLLSDIRRTAQMVVPETGARVQITSRAILNPGSVGQPRDRDARAAYALFFPETQTLEFRRVAYDVGSVQARMTAARLPERHIHRLSAGW